MKRSPDSEKTSKKSQKKTKQKKEKVVKILSLSQKELLVLIENRLKTLIEENPVECISLEQDFTAEKILELTKKLDTCGVIVFKDALNDQIFEKCKQNWIKAFEIMFGEKFTEAQLEEIRQDITKLDQYRNSKNGFGNSSFGYLSKHFTKKEETPTTKIGDETIYLAHNSVHSQVNLQLLLENPHLCAILLAMTHIDGMVSWDSAKYAKNPRPKPKTMTAQDLTKVHFDVYGGKDAISEGERCQVLVVREGKIKLGYVPFTHDKELQQLIEKYLEKPGFFSKRGFIGISDEHLIKIFEKFWVAPPTNSMVMWRPTVVHFEAEASEPQPNLSGLCKFVSFKNLGNQERWRFVVGIHKPVGLSANDLTELGRLSEHSIIPDFYFNINQGTKVYQNIKNGKSTQWKIPREMSEKEKQHFTTVISSKETDDTFENLAPLKKHLHGVSQPIENCGFSEKDTEMLKKVRKIKKI